MVSLFLCPFHYWTFSPVIRSQGLFEVQLSGHDLNTKLKAQYVGPNGQSDLSLPLDYLDWMRIQPWWLSGFMNSKFK